MMVVLVALLMTGHPVERGLPKWLDWSLAGYSFAYDDKHEPIGVYDPTTKFFLIRDIVCDGASLTLLLTRDHKEISEMGYSMPGGSSDDTSTRLHVKPLPSLSTGRGLKIGDSIATVEARLGTPSEQNATGNRDQFVELDYSWTEVHGDDSRVYEEKYTFKKDRLIEICFSWDPGND